MLSTNVLIKKMFLLLIKKNELHAKIAVRVGRLDFFESVFSIIE